MKKQFFTVLCLCLGIFSFAQVLTTNNGQPINDGDTFSFSHLGEEMQILITNNTSANMFSKIRVVEITNNEAGGNLQLCYGGICLAQIQENVAYPTNMPVVITPGRTNNAFDHMVNNHPGDNPAEPVTYVLSFVQLTQAGEIIEDSAITFSYVYTGNLGVNDVQATSGKLIKNSLVGSDIFLNTTENGMANIYSLDGKLLNSFQNAGTQISVQNLKAGSYILVFKSETGKVSAQKFMKK